MTRRPLDDVGYLGFDVFGTVVDWRSGVARAVAPFVRRHGLDLDPVDLADEWRSRYQPSMQRVRSGARDWVTLDVLQREDLEAVLAGHGVDVGSVPEAELADLARAWERLDPWPDVVEGLTRLRARFRVGTVSNGHVAGMRALATHGGLPWDAVTGAELARTYKPEPEVYLASAAAVGLAPERVAMVAAHNGDLEAARALGLRTVFVRRPHEHGPGQTTDLEPSQDWDLVVDSLTALADALDLPRLS